MTKTRKAKTDVKALLVDKLVTAIQQAQSEGIHWLSPFVKNHGIYHNVERPETPYRGINILMAGLLGNGDTQFCTYSGWQRLGAQVPKRVKCAFHVVKFELIETRDSKKARASNPNLDAQFFPMLKSWPVWGISQVENAPANLLNIEKPEAPSEIERNAMIDEYVKNTGATIKHGHGHGACFIPSVDEIHMPGADEWTDGEAYYPVLLHELTHWTGHKSRLDRLKSRSWGDRDYAFEELIAEIGAAMQCQKLGLSIEPREDHAHYLAGWLTKLKSDVDYIFKAAAFAQKAVDFTDSLQAQQAQQAEQAAA